MRELSRWAQGRGMPASYAAYLGVHGMSTGLHKAGTLKQTVFPTWPCFNEGPVGGEELRQSEGTKSMKTMQK